MTAISIRRYSHGDRVYVRAQQVWLILVGHIMNSSGKFADRLLTYGNLAAKMGINTKGAIGLGRELGIIGDFCLKNNLPALNCIVVGHQTGAPGPGVVVGRNKTWRDEARDSFGTDWFVYRVPSTGTFRNIWEGLSEEGE